MARTDVKYRFTATDAFTRVANKIGRSVQKTRKQFRGLKFDIKKTGKAFKELGQKTRAFSLASAAALGLSVKRFGDLEAGLAATLTLLGNKEAVNKWRDSLKQMQSESRKLGFSTEVVNDALFNQISKLGAGEVSFEAFRQAQILAISGSSDLSVTVAGISAIMNAYGVDMKTAELAANALSTAQAAGSTSVQELAENFGEIGGVAANAGIKLDELLGVMSQMTQAGLNTNLATSALSTVLDALITPEERASKALTHLLIPWGKAEIAAAGLTNVLRALQKANEEQPKMLALALPAWGAMKGLMNLTAERLDVVDQIMKQLPIDIATGTGMVEGFNINMATLNRQMLMTAGSVDIAASALGEEMAPVFTFVAKIVRKLADWFTDLGSTAKSIIGSILAVGAVLSPFLTAIGTFMLFIGKGAIFLGAIISSVGLLIGAALIGIIAVTVLVVKNWDSLIEKARAVGSAVKGFFGFGGGGEQEVALTGSGTLNQSSQTDVNVNFNDPKDMIASVKSVTTGMVPGLNIGVNLAAVT